MNKTFKKSDINKYMNKKNLRENIDEEDINEEEINELIDANGSMISRNNNYVQNRNYIKSKKTSDDFVRNATQGPEAYFIYGGPYYGINYNYVVNEEEELLSEEDDIYDELNVVPDENELHVGRKLADIDIKKHYHKRGFPDQDYKDSREWPKHSLPYDTEFDFDLYESEDSMRKMVDEIVRNKRDIKGMVKKTNEQDIVGDDIIIPDIMELKDVHEKPMVIRKVNSLMDLIGKEDLKGEELTILLNHIIDNIDISTMDEKHKEMLGDKLKYGEEEK
jgi:hypothetical protein